MFNVQVLHGVTLLFNNETWIFFLSRLAVQKLAQKRAAPPGLGAYGGVQ